MEKKSRFSTYKIVFVGIMASVVYVVTIFRFPLFGSKVHFANAMCLLSGLLFGPLYGGLAAGLGSGLYDAHDRTITAVHDSGRGGAAADYLRFFKARLYEREVQPALAGALGGAGHCGERYSVR